MSETVARIPANTLYWTLLSKSEGALAQQIQYYRFERVIPVAIEAIEVASARLPDGRRIFVGMERERLRKLLTEMQQTGIAPWAAIPDSIPNHLLAQGVDESVVSKLDMLRNDFIPVSRKRLKTIVLTIWLLAGVLVMALLMIGIERRVAINQTEVQRLKEEGTRIVEAVLPEGMDSGLPAETRLMLAVRRLDQSTQVRQDRGHPVDRLLEAFFKRWPGMARIQVNTLTVDADRITVRGTAQNLAEVESLVTSVGTLVHHGVPYSPAPLDAQQQEGHALFSVVWAAQEVR